MRGGHTKKKDQEERGGFLRLILIVALAAWMFRSLILAPFSISSGSMLPTLYIGDYVATAKWPYGYSRYSFPFGIPPVHDRIFADLPERGDVVVFRPPENDEDFVKRVIGVPGDTVELRDGRVILNGRMLERSDRRMISVPVSPNSPCRKVTAVAIARTAPGQDRCAYPAYLETLPNGVSYRVIDQIDNGIADTMPAAQVPPGRLFLMGDNRDDSLDSRFSVAEGGIGFVPLENIVGRGSFLFWSTDGSASYLEPWTWFTALRTRRIGKGMTSAR